MAKKPPRRTGAVALLDSDTDKQGRDDSPVAKERRAYKHWMDEIQTAKKVFEDYVKRGRHILALYKSDEKGFPSQIKKTNDRMNILWSNTETLKPALYSQTPNPNVSRRFMDGDPVSRTASMILERCLVTAVELADFNYPMMRARDDYLLPGRGTVWVRYAPTLAMLPMREPVTKIDMGESGSLYRPYKGGDEVPAEKVQKDEDGLEYYETDPVEQVLAHGLDIDHLVWSDFLHDPVNDWTKVGWIAKRVDMKRPKLIKEFGDKGRQVATNKVFNAQSKDEQDGIAERGKADCAEVWEIWSKDHNCVYWISDGLPDTLLKHEEDPLGLSDFWPMPRPLFATTTTDSLIPVPDYSLYQDQAEQLDLLTDRIRRLIEALRVVGVYNASLASLSGLLNETDENEMLPVDDWVPFAQGNGLKGNLDWLPIDQIAAVLKQLFQARAQIKQDLYEVTGISDVIRGATAPEETATAQQIKSNFANLRLKARQDEMARFARDTLRKMAEIIAEQFPEEELVEMSGIMSLDEFRQPTQTGNPQEDAAAQQKYQAGVQRVKEAVALLKSDKLRTFKIDVETDATVAPDQKAEKEARVEFLTAVTPFIEKASQVGAASPQLVPLLMKMLDFGVKGFRAGRTLEAAIEETIQTAEKMLAESQAAPQGPPPDPVAEAQAAELQAKTQKVQEELTQAQAAAQVKAQENEAARLEADERRARERETFRLKMIEANEALQTKRAEHEQKMKLLELQIAEAECRLEQLRNAGPIEEIRSMIPQPGAEYEQAAKQSKVQAELAQSQYNLAELKKKFADLQRQSQGLDGVGEALGVISADSLGTLEPNKPPKKPAIKKTVRVSRDPATGDMIGTIDEIEQAIEDEGQAA